MTFFPEETQQRIRYLHFKIKHLEEALEKEDEKFSLDDLNLISEYTMILNVVRIQNQDQKKILKELNITQYFNDIEIKDVMFECARALRVLAKAYAFLSENYEENEEWENAIIAMTNSSKIYKTAAYFSTAAIYQDEKGEELDPENLELLSEETRILAQSIGALKEEQRNNLYFSSKLHAGLSALSKRLFYLKNHEEKKKQQVRAQFHYDMGRACHLKALASKESSLTGINKDKVKKLLQKANFYYEKSKDIWTNMLETLKEISNEEQDNLKENISIVNDHLKENDVEPLAYEQIKKIQDPEPIIIVPENLAPFVPKSTVYLTKYVPKDLNQKRFKSFKNKKLETKIPYSKKEKLLDKKAGIVRTINELKQLEKDKDIEIEKFTELMEKYTTKLNMIDTALEKLANK
ncbi:MAG: hypothetical protein ACFFAS_01720 [Promethearchaeota archaeon]